MSDPDRIVETEILLNRIEVFERLCQSPAHVRDLVEETDQSRRTISRAVNELEDANFVERGDRGIEATTAGRLALERLNAYFEELDDVRNAEAVLDPVPPEADISTDVVVGCEPILGVDPTPYRPLERLHDDLMDATGYRAVVPTLTDSRDVRLLYEHVVTEEHPAELVVPPDVFETLRTEFPRRMATMSDTGQFSVFVGSQPLYGLVLLDHERPGADTPQTTAYVVVFDERRGVHGLLVNDSDEALRWATDQFLSYRREADNLTDALTPDADGGVQTVSGLNGVAPTGQSLPVSLEREGFVRVDVEYFRDTPVADPVTAWRAGLSLAEVHTGYAIERAYPLDDHDEQRDDLEDALEEQCLSDAITADLVAGSDCVVVGQPGSGKSTVCKQVACEWYQSGRGAVLYRESNRGRSFRSVEDLVTTARDADGHTLVVVEDAVRPDADAVFEALAELADCEDVSLLFDARDSEWFGRDDPGTVTDLEVVYVPPVDEADCRRLVRHFERTTGHETDVSTARLWDSVRDEAATNAGNATNEMLRLTHRLATYADPLADDSTALEETAAAVYDDLADDEVALSVATLATALIVTGQGVDRSLLYAVSGDDFADVDVAIDRLEGYILFQQDDEVYRTVHEAWATAFLSHSLDVDEDEAAQRFGAVLTAVLSLADEPERCRRIASHLDDSGALERVRAEPQEWADELVDAVADLCYRRSSLTPLLGDGSDDTIDFPDACSETVVANWPLALGDGLLTASYTDRAARAFERLGADDSTDRWERLIGLGLVRYQRGEYDEALEHYEEGLAIAQEQGDTRGEALTHKNFGLARWRLGSYEAAREHFEAGIDLARQLDDQKLEARINANMGVIAWSEGDYDRAREHDEARLETARKIWDRYDEATALNNLGCTACRQGAYDRARSYHEEALDLRRTVGYRSGEASCLTDLGHVASRCDALDEAVAFYEAALDIATEIDYARERGESLWGLGAVATARGDYEMAQNHLDEALAAVEETGNRLHISRVTLEQARLAFECERTEAAREQAERALALAEELGATYERAQCQKLLGRLAADAGEYDAAREHFIDALDLFEEMGTVDDALETLESLVDTCHSAGDAEAAREHLDRASALLADAPEATAKKHREWVETGD